MSSHLMRSKRLWTRTRRRLTAAVVVLVVAGAVWSIRRPTEGVSADYKSPQGCVGAMVAAEKADNAEKYLDCFFGPLRERLQIQFEERPALEQGSPLDGAALMLTGHVVSELEIIDPQEATLVLERIYRDYNTRHQVRLREINGQWKIIELTPLGRFTPDRPYGTPITSESN